MYDFVVFSVKLTITVKSEIMKSVFFFKWLNIGDESKNVSNVKDEGNYVVMGDAWLY